MIRKFLLINTPLYQTVDLFSSAAFGFSTNGASMSNTIIKNTDATDEFPREITFKAVFRINAEPRDTIHACLSTHEIDYTLSEKVSGKNTFISYTISAHYESEALLNAVCDDITSIDGFMMMV